MIRVRYLVIDSSSPWNILSELSRQTSRWRSDTKCAAMLFRCFFLFSTTKKKKCLMLLGVSLLSICSFSKITATKMFICTRINDSYFGDHHMHENHLCCLLLKILSNKCVSVCASIVKFLFIYKVLIQFLLSFMFLKPAFRYNIHYKVLIECR